MSQEEPQKNDYPYDSKDIVKLKTAFDELEHDERVGFWVGVGTWMFGLYLNRRIFPNMGRGLNNVLGFFYGVTGYNLYTHKSRMGYQRIATYTNGKVTKDIHRAMRFN